MSNEDGSCWIVFNGEIYNHRHLRRSLENKGHVFRGSSDTEVLPHLYEDHGSGFITKLLGMFAFAIYDARDRTLVLGRDRFGIKPLFYAASRDRLAFASEIRALLRFPGIDRRPNKQAISDFAALLYIPAPETFYSGIRALEPGEMLEARFEGEGISWKTRKYHAWTIAPDLGMSLAQATDRAAELVTAAVERQMESEVPLGSLLSGGIDSSLISAAAQKALHGELRTFNVRFSDDKYDETWAAGMVAKHIGSRHESLDMDDVGGTWNHVTDLLSHAGQPFADTSLFAVNAISKLMRRRVTVAISGDGGDEAFGGYDVYWRLARVAKLQTLPSFFLEAAGVAMRPMSWLRLSPRHLPQRVQELADIDNTSVIQSLFSFISDRERKTLLQDADVLPVRRLFEPQWEHALSPSLDRIERLSAHATEVNARLVLPGDFLFKVDIASMKESLEVRVPMLDEDLFAFGLSLPQRLKVNGRTCKTVLRAVAARQLPPAVANKPKWGFSIPLKSWMKQDLIDCTREVLDVAGSPLAEFFRPEVFRPLVSAFCEGRSIDSIPRQELYPRVIMLLAVHLALRNTN